MFRYQLAAFALKSFSYNTFTRGVYRAIGNVVGQRRRLAVNDLPTRIKRGNLLLALVKKYDVFSQGDSVLELGTGWMHWFSLYIRLFHRVDIAAFDVWDNRQFMALQSAVTKLRRVFERDGVDAEVLANVDLILKSDGFDSLYKQLGIRYVLQPDGSLDIFRSATIDLITSFHVMEHVELGSVRTLVEGFSRVIKPGGYMIHQIGIDDHLSHYDTSASQKQYIVYSEDEWVRRFECSIGYINRIQASEWKHIFNQGGFELCEEIRESADISDLKVGPRFYGYSREDLECTIQTLVYRRIDK